MKKKLLALMLAAALALSLVACGGGSGAGDNNSTNTPSGGGDGVPTKEELLANAQDDTIANMYSAIQSNKVNAEDTYKGNTYIVAGFVETIESDYVELRTMGYDGNYTAKVYMPVEDIKELKTSEWIEVVGEVNVVDSKDTTGEYGVVFTSGLELSPARFVTNTFEVTGKLTRHIVSGVPKYWQIDLDGDTANSIFITSLLQEILSLEKEIPLVIGENTVIISDTEVNEGDNITISCRIVGSNSLRDVTLVSIN